MKYSNNENKLDHKTHYLVMVRHGQSMGNAWEQAYLNPEMNFLTELGEAQVRLAGIKLRNIGMFFRTIVTSRIVRARHSTAILAHIMGDWQRDFIIDARFNERISAGHAKGPNEGETLDSEHRQTVIGGIKDLLLPSLHSGNVMVVSHYYTMQVMFEYLSAKHGLSLSKLWGNGDHIPNGVPFIYDINDPFGRVIVLNDETRVPSY